MARSSVECLFGGAGSSLAGGVHNLKYWTAQTTNVTLASDEYVTRVVMDAEPGYLWNNASGNPYNKTAKIYLTNSGNAGTTYLVGSWDTEDHDYIERINQFETVEHINRQYNYQGADATITGGTFFTNKTLALHLYCDSDTHFTNYVKVTVYLGVVYSVTVASGITGGTVSADKSSAIQNETVTLTATPSSGYRFVSWNVRKSDNTQVQVDSNNKFTMPAGNVTVSAVFQAIHSLAWTTASSLSFSQEDYTLHAVMNGTASDSLSHSITYNLQMYYPGEQPRVYTFVDNQTEKAVDIPLTDSDIGKEYTFKIIASCAGGSTIDGATGSFTIKEVHKTVQYRINDTWVECIVYYRTNNTWKEIEPYYRINNTWQPCSKT